MDSNKFSKLDSFFYSMFVPYKVGCAQGYTEKLVLQEKRQQQEALNCSVCQFLFCRYFHDGQFQPT